MATAYSDEVAIGSYNRIRLRVEYSGTSATCYIEFRRTSSYTTTWADSSASITFNGTTIAAPYSYTGTVSTSWVQLVNVGGFTVSTSGGTYNWSFNNPGGVLGCSGTIVIGSQGTAPSGGYINGVTSYWDSAANEIRVHTTGAGVTNTGGLSLSELNWSLCDVPYVSGVARRSIALSSNGAASTLSNSLSTWTGTTIDVAPNKQLYLGLYATNSVGAYRYQGGSIITPPAPSTISNTAVTADTATFSYSTTADSGFYDKQIQYSLDSGSTWVTGATVTGGAASTGTFTISNLFPGVSYTMLTRTTTTAGSTAGPTVTVTTLFAFKLYGSVNNQAKGIKKLYGSANGQTKEITKLYGSVNGVTKRIF